MRVLKAAILLSFLLFGAPISRAQTVPDQDGLYAVFDTSMGVFVARLHYQETPRTVASFVGLASGTKNWLDYSKAQVVKRPFYDGLTFHRVVKGFVIQGGSPNGNGTDDPGYQFRDEFNPSLLHTKEGILSMANSGPNSNGSQFFVTLTNTPHLNNVHSVFGEVVSGIEVVRAIGQAPVDLDEKPTNTVFMHSVTIARVGRLAQNFNPAAVTPALPEPALVGIAISKETDGRLIAEWQRKQGFDYRICYTTDFNSWSGHRLGAFSGTYLTAWQITPPYIAHTFFRAFEAKTD